MKNPNHITFYRTPPENRKTCSLSQFRSDFHTFWTILTLSDLLISILTRYSKPAPGYSSITFDGYYSLLCNAAKNIDDAKSKKIRNALTVYRSHHKRLVNQAQADMESQSDFNDGVVKELIENDVDESAVQSLMDLIVHKAQYKRDPSTKIPQHIWDQFAKIDIPIFHRLSDETKRVLVKGLSNNQNEFKANMSALCELEQQFGDLQLDSVSEDLDGDADVDVDVDAVDAEDAEEYQANATDTKRRTIPRTRPKKNDVSPGDARRMLSQRKAKKTIVSEDGTVYQRINMSKMMFFQATVSATNDVIANEIVNETIYNIKNYEVKLLQMLHQALIDRGANGGMAGDDCCVIEFMEGAMCKVTGIDQHQTPALRLATVGGVVQTKHHGPKIAILQQQAYTGKGSSIISPLQLEAHGVSVYDKLKRFGGKQCIIAGPYTIPLTLQDGLMYMNMRPYTELEWSKFDHVMLTADEIWKPSQFDNDAYESDEDDDDRFEDAIQYSDYDLEGEYIGNLHVHSDVDDDEEVFYDTLQDSWDDSILRICYKTYLSNLKQYDVNVKDLSALEETDPDLTEVVYAKPFPRTHAPTDIDYEKLVGNFCWLPKKIIEKTFEVTTQFAKMPASSNLFK